MSVQTTRLLVLGIVLIYGPANGYQLRRELLTWDVPEWGHLRSGSIYSMLTTLEKQDLVERHELGTDGRRLSVYTITEAGVAEHRRLAREAIALAPEPEDVAPIRAVMNLGAVLPRDVTLDALRERADALREAKRQLARKVARISDPLGAPSQVFSGLRLADALLDTQLRWLESFTAEVQRGEHQFVGEPHPGDWARPADGPAMRMRREQAEYARRIEALRAART